jgi:acyl dehydratase
MKVAVGETFSGPAVEVAPEAMKVWAKVLHDPNPIHLDAAAVRAKGLGDRVINQGPANAAYVLNALMTHFAPARIEQVAFRFLDNLFGGETATPSIVVTAVEGARVSCDVFLDAGERRVVAGSAVLALD